MTDNPTLHALIADVLAATGPDREIDADVALALGWWREAVTFGIAPTQIRRRWCPPVGQMAWHCPAFTGSIDAALTTVPELCAVELTSSRDRGEWWCSLDDCRASWVRKICAPDEGALIGLPTPALALLAASLKARLV